MAADDTRNIEAHVCVAHSGIKEFTESAKLTFADIWKAIDGIRDGKASRDEFMELKKTLKSIYIMFATTMLSTTGALVLMLFAIFSKRVGL